MPVDPPKLEPAPAAVGTRRTTSQLPDVRPEWTQAEPAASGPRHADAASGAQHLATAGPAPLPAQAEADVPRPLAARPLVKQSREVRVALKPARAGIAAVPDALEPQAGRIDLDELSVRISGHNLALARLAGRLQDANVWQLAQLTDAVGELEDLSARRGDLTLYWDLISDEQRLVVGVLDSPSAALSMLSRKISASRVAAIGGHGDQPTDAHDPQAAQFDGLSRRLVQLAGHRAGQ